MRTACLVMLGVLHIGGCSTLFPFEQCDPQTDDTCPTNCDAGNCDESADETGVGLDTPDDDEEEILVGSPESFGPYDIYRQDDMVGANQEIDFNITIWAPSTDGGVTAATDRPNYPMVVIAPAYPGDHTSYTRFAEHLASWGIIATGATPAFLPHDENWAWATDYDQTNDATQMVIAGYYVTNLFSVDTNRMAIAGHAAGGKVAFMAAAEDTRFKTIVAWEPVNLGGAPCSIDPTQCERWPVAPTATDPGTLDMISPEAAVLVMAVEPVQDTPGAPSANDPSLSAERFFEAVSGPNRKAMLVKFLGEYGEGTHSAWSSGESRTIDSITMRTQVAWLRKHLDDVDSYDEFLYQDVERSTIANDVDDGIIETRHYPAR